MEHTLLESGQVILHHPRTDCIGRWCAIHQPMPGPWNNWPRQWRDDRGILERVCACGVGHPVAEDYGRVDTVHGCCGCRCHPDFGGQGYNDDSTQVIAIPEEEHPAITDLRLKAEAMDLLIEWWPKNSYATLHLEPHEWARLRRLLLALVERTLT